MKAAILTMASIRRYDNHIDALSVLDERQRATVLNAIQQQHLSDEGMLILIEGYASKQSVGSDQEILLFDALRSEASGNNPNTELLNREVIYTSGRGILSVRVVYTTNPLKRIVYDIANGEIREAHV
jgi:hypothetical protein